jgi:hypothetical protein
MAANNLLIYSHLPIVPSADSAKNAVDLFPITDNVNDIKLPRSLHIETVLLLEKK